jgi:cellulose synthase/poly-beta-1,6-N-acetylglucosamine synthase-like glycosyltransferase
VKSAQRSQAPRAHSDLPLLRELVYRRGMGRLQYREEASRIAGLPCLDEEPEKLATLQAQRLVETVGAETCLAHLFVPFREEADGSITVLVADPFSPRHSDLLTAAFGERSFNRVVGTDLDVARLVVALRKDDLLHRAIDSLAEAAPSLSSTSVLGSLQRAGILASLVLVVGSALLFPSIAGRGLIIFLNVVFFGLALSILTFVLAGLRFRLTRAARPPRPDPQREDWPTYTVLVPMYREPPKVVAQLIRNLDRLDYPKDRLDVILLLEEDDEVTVRSCKKVRPPAYMRLVTVPPSLPRTKPKALNWGLLFAQGNYVTVYDAEDAPETDQLKLAVEHFERGGPRLACVQAALNFYNAKANLLTRFFALEYCMWFDNVIPGLRSLGMAFPLGGTSNHLVTRALKEVGGWDPFNVTEDADLGFRFQRMGHQVEFLPSTTLEEASSRLTQWLRQRSRWVKGYMTTWLVHGRNPVRLLREVGPRAWLSFNILIGGTSLAFLSYVPLSALSLLSVFRPDLVDPLFPSWARLPELLVWIMGILATTAASALGAVIRRWWHLLWITPLIPFYWVLHSMAAWWALYELIFKPFYWQRTPHGYHLRADEDAAVPEPAGPAIR